MKAVKVVLLAVVLAIMAFAALSTPARAQEAVDRPLLSWDRASFAGGVNYAWHAAPAEDSAPVPPFGKEWEAGIYGAYNISPLLSIAGSSVYGFDNKLVETRLGFRIRLGRGE
jgi:hypothetical protein